ncbi:MAG: UDP-N-acetylglucosamine--N-acetylmuramyl-(pentapeptide) pyrophosphoryl-undecaprenol N-acetylglucosamine transferase [Candidatus Pacebacteria bacterium]|nr:UDP-N-acetylglucosamine--N-acetylmuramyl-(pentapeptide) pyrophosphoryl-undecaprenol N-acetylglucosamine transferase [Candidatus Paceibacterota bacterium]
MKIVLTGAGGGHFYPLIAVALRVRKEAFIQKILQPDFYFFSDKPYDEEALFDIECKFVEIPAGKLTLYFSLQLFTGFFKTAWGVIRAVVKLYSIYPDVVFAKGGYASFPTLFAARILSIPVIVHESDTVPGRVTTWAGKFAERVALSYSEAAPFYPAEKVALTGQPIRDELLPEEDFFRSYDRKERPVILVFGGSQGSQRINDALLSILPTVLNSYDVVHQTGIDNIEVVKEATKSILSEHEFKDRYYAEGFIDVSLFYPKVDLVVTRAGSSMFEMVEWRLPMIVIPIPETVSRDQRTNAYTMAGYGAATVIEEENLGPNILVSAITRILDDEKEYMNIVRHAERVHSSRQAASTIAREIIRISLSHMS